MRTVRTVADLRAALRDLRYAGATVGLVITQPTMGHLHGGHLALVRRARDTCDVVVVSLFLSRYEPDWSRDPDGGRRNDEPDAAAAAAAGADLLFAPAREEVYPPGFASEVRVRGLTEPLEGVQRGVSHFHGVTTVVTKTLNMTRPDVAFVGQKDAQQVLVVRKLVRDLDLPVRIEVCPTAREPDGVPISSHNLLLTPEDRRRAAAVLPALEAARCAADSGEREPSVLVRAARDVLSACEIEPEYLELVSTDALEPVHCLVGEALLVVAVRFGDTRVIDNLVLRVTT
ncbi:MAG TPA: pantoate--beta-alanine ligase [Nocardioidaceae bacterium]